MTFTKPSIPKQLLIHSPLVHMEHSQELTTDWDTEITSTNMTVEIIPTIFYDHNALKLEINCKKKSGKITKTWRLNNMLIKNNWVREEIKREIKRYL